jgi:hypothetical protein
MTAPDAAAMAEEYSGHSLRAWHATPAAQNDAPEHVIQRQLRHSPSTRLPATFGTEGCSRDRRHPSRCGDDQLRPPITSEQQAVTQQQRLITEQGYGERAESNRTMQDAEEQAAGSEKNAAFGADLGAGIQGLMRGSRLPPRPPTTIRTSSAACTEAAACPHGH